MHNSSMTNPYGYDPRLPNGAHLTFLPGVNPQKWFRVTWDGHTLTCVSMSDRCTITVQRAADLPESARIAGERLSHASSLGLAIMLAFIARRGQIPSEHFCQEMHFLTGLVLSVLSRSIPRGAPVLSDTQIARQASEALAASQQHENYPLYIPEGPWNAARTLFEYGTAAWRLRGRDAQVWFTMPLYVDGKLVRQDVKGVVPLDNRQILWHCAGICLTDDLRKQLPIPYPTERAPMSVFVSWQDIAPGAEHLVDIVRTAVAAPPSSHRRADAPKNSVEAILATVLPEDAEKPIPTLTTSARRIVRHLLRTDRPYPRFLGRLLEADIPVDAVPELAEWFTQAGVSAVWLVPTTNGLWVALRDQRPDRAWMWWEPSLEQGDRILMGSNPRVWPATHLLLCTLWHDLCADAEVITEAGNASPEPAAPRPQGKSRGRAVKPAVITLPQRISPARVQWATAEERKAIRSTTRRGHAYRRLPEGWEELAQQSGTPNKAQRAYQQRREAAIARAEDHGQPPPPVGYTYVRPYGQMDSIGPLQPRVRVRPRGLFTLALELPVIGQEIADAAEDE